MVARSNVRGIVTSLIIALIRIEAYYDNILYKGDDNMNVQRLGKARQPHLEKSINIPNQTSG